MSFVYNCFTTSTTTTTVFQRVPIPVVLAAFWGAVLGTAVTLAMLGNNHPNKNKVESSSSETDSPAMALQKDRLRRLPQTILLVRHGESEANADQTLWKTIPDNLFGLTRKGRREARAVGQRVEALLEQQKAQRVHLVVSPFERTLQTAHYMRRAFEPRVVRTDVESRIREQEMGNLQKDEEFGQFRREQNSIGRFWYRFPTGESGADVLDRVKSWWFDSVLTVNIRPHFEHVDAMVIVTHGLTMRFILMQLFSWSPTTFHSAWNAGNCDMYVLRKDLEKPGLSPYCLDPQAGDMPQSSIALQVTFRNKEKPTRCFTLNDYLSIPPPRMIRLKLIRHLLAEQYPEEIGSPKEIDEIIFMPFIEKGVIRGRSSSGVYNWGPRASSSSSTTRNNSEVSTTTGSDSDHDDGNNNRGEATEERLHNSMAQHPEEEDSSHEDDEEGDDAICRVRAQQESSLRYPCGELVESLKELDSETDT